MSADRLKPNDPRVRYETTTLRGKTYSYILGEGDDVSKGTILLIHGFPDIAFGWRCQIPHLMSLGYRVVAPEMLGYGGTDAPADESQWAHRSVSADMAELARKFVGSTGQIVLGGHDWGGALVWRMTLWHPELIRGVFSVCTPFPLPRQEFVSLEMALDAGKLPNFRYQLQFKSGKLEEELRTPERIGQFLNALYGGRTDDGQMGFSTDEGAILDMLPKLNQSPLVSREELDFIVGRYVLQKEPQLRGPCNWYRTAKYNYDDELELFARREAAGASDKPWIEVPALFVAASRDSALPPSMSAGMDAAFADLTRAEVEASHWALTQAADAVNAEITKFIARLEESKASL
ncbi:alpha/beta hydrolase fold [Geosmithia morbida]|uniref:Alpha/beta hydrolase fold n=1 Tax=Geosmithia morbida TaxID=1094350 RepID=A0A9P4YSM1_9HYPO|nr:alpha/beta hydrolase fold [Geosmithia morbida]KAF4121315.1 alpha/beta hydrolase fold [Geosmithia morbida]